MKQVSWVEPLRVVVTFQQYVACSIGEQYLTDAKNSTCIEMVKCYGRRLVLNMESCKEMLASSPYSEDVLNMLDSAANWMSTSEWWQQNPIDSVEQDQVFSASQDPMNYSVLDPYRDTNSTAEAMVYSVLDLYNDNSSNGTLFFQSLKALTPTGWHQWNLEAINAYEIWSRQFSGDAGGSAAKSPPLIAVLDSGLEQQAARTFFDNRIDVEWGYDFVSDSSVSKDGDGRDSDFADPGDADEAYCPGVENSWHGTRVSSILASNFSDFLGAAPSSRILPVRVLGRCGVGYASDVADGIVWAAGGSIRGLGTSGVLADAIIMPLAGMGRCPSFMQTAVNLAVSRGIKLFAAAGNSPGKNAADHFPANCAGVLSVGALNWRLNIASYSSRHASMYMPGGDLERGVPCLGADFMSRGIEQCVGTSFAVPHAAALYALGFSDYANWFKPFETGPAGNTSYLEDVGNDGIVRASGVTSSPAVALSAVAGSTGTYYMQFVAGSYNVTFDSSLLCTLFMIAGGGGAGDDYSGGGGAGAYFYSAVYTFKPGTYTFNVGSGGAGEPDTRATQPQPGGDTFIKYPAGSGKDLLRVKGGGRGTSWSSSAYYNGGDGGCSGGGLGAILPNTQPGATTNAGTNGTGFKGGIGYITCPTAGGGGGIAGVGGNSTCAKAGNGGAALPLYIKGFWEVYGGGGGGSAGGITGIGKGGGAFISSLSYTLYSGGDGCNGEGGCIGNNGVPNTGSGAGGGKRMLGGSGSGGTIILKYSLCNAGTYLDMGAMVCTNCPRGSYTTIINTDPSCTLCPSGTYSSVPASTTPSNCLPCAAGTYSLAGNSSCSVCQAGTYSSSNGSSNCTRCQAGSYASVPGSTACLSCAMGSYAPLQGSSVCSTCAAGSYADAVGSTVCTLCPVGTYSSSINATSSSACKACAAGTYSAAGSPSCAACPAGTYSPSPGSSNCTACPNGTWTQGNSSTSASQCLPSIERKVGPLTIPPASLGCVGGAGITASSTLAGLSFGNGTYTVQVSTTASSVGANILCAFDKRANTFAFWESPNYMWNGAYIGNTRINPGGALGAWISLNIPFKAFLGNVSIDCSGVNSAVCPLNYAIYGKNNGTSTSWTTLSTVSGASYAVGGVSTLSSISNVDVAYDTFALQIQALSPYGSQYMDALLPEISFTGYTYKDCPPGTYVLDYNHCGYCQIGTYSSQANSLTCTPCQKGTYLLSTGASSCLQCPAGTYADASGSTFCTSCSAGTYSTSLNATSSSTCTPCAAGTYSNVVGGTNCTACPPGSYSSFAGSTNCTPCPNGTWTLQNSSTNASQCLPSLGRQAVQVTLPPALPRSSGTASGALESATLSGLPFGNGVYTAQVSGTGTNPLSAFDGDPSTFATCGVASYASNGSYIGSSTLYAGGPLGEWISLAFPYDAVLTSLSLDYSQLNASLQPLNYMVFGRKNGTGSATWNLLVTVTGASYSAGNMHTLSSISYGGAPYNVFAFQVQALRGGYSGSVGLTIGGLSFTANAYNDCPMGTYALDSNNCAFCLPGTYSSLAGSLTCAPCQRGSYFPSYGASSCLQCPGGTYSDADGRSACTGCSAGTYSASVNANSNSTCRPCAAGTYSNAAGVTNCTVCPAGTYANSTGRLNCTACPNGTWTLQNSSTSASQCIPSLDRKPVAVTFPPSLVGGSGSSSTPGTQDSATLSGLPFGNGPYTVQTSSTGTSLLTAFDGRQDTFVNWESSAFTPSGAYQGSSSVYPGGPLGAWISLSLPYKAALTGITLDQSGLGAAFRPVNYTIYGRTASGVWTILATVTGATYVAPGIHTLPPLNLGNVAYDTFAFQINAMAGGFTGSMDAVIGDLSFAASAYQDCPAGMYTLDSQNCAYCQHGTYSPSAGSLSCTPCPPGTYGNATSLVSCTPCPLGTFSNATAAISLATCIPCPPGTFSNSTAGSPTCKACLDGSYSSVSGASSCMMCPKGTATKMST